MVSSPAHISELSDAPLDKLSLHAVAKDVCWSEYLRDKERADTFWQIFQPKYTMYGFEWQEKRGVEGTGFVRALRSLLTAHLPSFLPTLRSMIEQSVREEIAQSPSRDGENYCFAEADWAAGLIFSQEILKLLYIPWSSG